MNKLYCPYCGSEQFHHYGNRYECEECNWLFDEDDIKWQELRHTISHYLIDTDEEHPFVFGDNNKPIIGENWVETFGLSTNDMFHLDKIFQIPGDGTIWLHIEGEYDETDSTGLKWHDLEEDGFLMADDLESIIESMDWEVNVLNRKK